MDEKLSHYEKMMKQILEDLLHLKSILPIDDWNGFFFKIMKLRN